MPADKEKLGFFASPASYPHAPEQVEMRKTHISWIFLAGDRVDKLKKPARFPLLDFRSLKASFRLGRGRPEPAAIGA